MVMTLGGVNYSVGNYNNIDRSAQNTAQKITTASNHPSASSDPAAYAIDARLTSNVRGTSQSIQNTQNLSSMFKIAEGSTNNISRALEKIRANVISAANDTNAVLDRRAIQKEINQTVAQIDANAYVQYNGINLLDSTRKSFMFAGIDGYETFPIGDLRAQALGLTDAQGNVRIDVSTVEVANEALKIVDSAATKTGEILDSMHFFREYVVDGFSFSNILDEATTQGAQLQRLDAKKANYMTMEENQLAALSNSNDVNWAEQISNLHNEHTQQQFALFAMKMFDQNRANILTLLP